MDVTVKLPVSWPGNLSVIPQIGRVVIITTETGEPVAFQEIEGIVSDGDEIKISPFGITLA